MKAPRLKSHLLTFFSVANLWFLRSVGALAQADGAKASPKTAGRNFRRATAPNYSGKKLLARNVSKLQQEEIAGAQRLQTTAGRNCWRATAPNYSRKKLLARNGSKLQQEEIAGAQWLQTTAGRNCRPTTR